MHVGLEYALCSRCLCLISAFTRCDTFPVHLLLPPILHRSERKFLLVSAFAIAFKYRYLKR